MMLPLLRDWWIANPVVPTEGSTHRIPASYLLLDPWIPLQTFLPLHRYSTPSGAWRSDISLSLVRSTLIECGTTELPPSPFSAWRSVPCWRSVQASSGNNCLVRLHGCSSVACCLARIGKLRLRSSLLSYLQPSANISRLFTWEDTHTGSKMFPPMCRPVMGWCI